MLLALTSVVAPFIEVKACKVAVASKQEWLPVQTYVQETVSACSAVAWNVHVAPLVNPRLSSSPQPAKGSAGLQS